MSKTIFFIIIGTLAVGFLISNAVFSFKSVIYNFEENDIFLEIKNSLEGKLIYSFKLKPNCSSEEEILTLDVGFGFKKGCKCNDNIKKGICSKDDIKNKCENTAEIEYNKINSNYICVKKSKNTYKDLMKSNQILHKDSKCPNNFRLCGIIDTLGNIFCVPQHEICPITMADLEHLNITYKNNNIYQENLTTNNAQILSIFKLREKNFPCIDPRENSEKCSTKILGKIYDNRYEKINSINTTKYELYKDNSIIDYFENETMNEIIYLYARNFIGFKSESIEKYDFNILISKQKLSNNCALTLKILFIILLVALLLPCMSLLSKGAKSKDVGISIVCLIIIIILNFCIDLILSIIIYICSLEIKTKLNIKGNDEYTNELIQSLIDYHSINAIFSLVNIIIFVFIVLFSFIYLGYIKRKKCLENKDEKRISQNFNDFTNKQNTQNNSGIKVEPQNQINVTINQTNSTENINTIEQKNNVILTVENISIKEEKNNNNFPNDTKEEKKI